MSDGTRHIKVHLGRTGNDSRVEVDGVDISRYLTGIQVSTAVDEVTTVVLSGYATVEAEGEAIIKEVAPRPTADPRDDGHGEWIAMEDGEWWWVGRTLPCERQSRIDRLPGWLRWLVRR